MNSNQPIAAAPFSGKAAPHLLNTSWKRTTSFVSVVLLILGIICLNTIHFEGRNYRQDEIITAHASTFRDIPSVIAWMADDIHPPLWRIIAVTWAGQFGQDESITRFLSTLLTALTLALTYRTTTDLLNSKAGLMAVFVLGTLSHFQFYSHEFRPYAALIMLVIASQLTFLRWLRNPGRLQAFLFLVTSAAAIYVHYFAFFLLAGQAVAFLLLVRWNRRLLLQTVALFVAIALIYLPWLPVFLRVITVTAPTGVTYAYSTTYNGLTEVHELMQIRPFGLGILLLLASVIIPASQFSHRRRGIFRSQGRGSIWIWVINLTVLLLVIIANTEIRILTPRNLSIVVPGFAILAAFTLTAMPSWLRTTALIIILFPAVFAPQVLMRNAPYSEVLAEIRPQFESTDRVIINVGDAWYYNGVMRDYLADRLPDEAPEANFLMLSRSQMLEMVNPEDGSVQPERLLTAISNFIDDSDDLWLVEDSNAVVSLGNFYKQVIESQYVLVEQEVFEDSALRPYTLTTYRRIPDSGGELRFGEDVALVAWQLPPDAYEASACDVITLETWWRADQILAQNYSMTLTLADATGVGVAREDRIPAGLLPLQWEAGRVYWDERSVQIPCDASAGDYPLLIGWYNFETVDPLPATTSDGVPLGNLAYLTTIKVR